MQRKIVSFTTSVLFVWVAVPQAAYGTDLDLPTALSRVSSDNPRVAAFASRQREADARVVQAGMPLNPSLRTELENFAGSGAFDSTDSAETTVLLSQSFEVGGKRSQRRRVAELERDLAAWDYENARRRALYEATVAFVDVLAAQELLALSEDGIALAGKVLSTKRRRVDAGSSSRVELTRAEVAYGNAGLERDEYRRALDTARRRLAATWGSSTPGFDHAVGLFDNLQPVPSLAEMRPKLDNNPRTARWTTELEHRQSLVELEERRAVPNVTLGAGYRRLSGPDDSALVAEFSVPLPLFDRRQGNVREARERALRTVHERRTAEVDLYAELADAHATLAAAHAQSETLAMTILPSANDTFRIIRAGFSEGRFSALEVLDAQRTLVATRSRHVRALADYHRAVATVEWLTGQPQTASLVAIEPE